MNTNIETIFRCDRCDQDFPIFEKIEFEDDQFCCECLNMVTAICSFCGKRIYKCESHGTYHHPLCADCAQLTINTDEFMP